MKRSFLILLLILTISALLTSCASRYYVSTNAFVDSKVIPKGFSKGSSFAILAPKKDNALFSKEVTLKIESLLKERGYTVANQSHAKYLLSFDFSISSSTETVTVPLFIPGQTHSTQGSVYGSYGNFANFNQTTQSSGTTIFVPKTYVIFTRKLGITVYENKLLKWGKTDEPIWAGNSISSGQNGDLREVMNYLLVSAFKHFGVSTGKYVDNELKVGNKTVKKLKEGS